jgi:hypothetical protein
MIGIVQSERASVEKAVTVYVKARLYLPAKLLT